MSKIEVASWWLARGFALLPTQPGRKFLYTGYGEFQNKITRTKDASRWFDNDSVNMSVCGHGGTIILDFDDAELHKSWSEKHPELAQTYTERTPRGGAHVFFFGSAPKGIQLVAGVELKKVCVVSPSVVNGREYQRGAGEIIEAHAEEIFSSLSRVGTKSAYVLHIEQRQQNRKPYRSKTLIEEIKAQYEIRDVLSARFPGRYYFDNRLNWQSVHCPLHDDQHQSMGIDNERGIFVCHGCGAKGDVINLYALLNGISNNDAIYELSRGLKVEQR